MKNNLLNKIIIIIVALIIICLGFLLFHNYLENKKIVFNINDQELFIKKGESQLINFTLENAKTNVTWESSDSNIAIVDESGNITGINYGKVTITGSIMDKEEELKQELLVTIYTGTIGTTLTDFSIGNGELYISNGNEYLLPLTLTPSDGYITSIKYDYGSNISMTGNIIKGVSKGTTNLKVTINDIITKNINVNVVDESITPGIYNKVNSISFKDKSLTLKLNEKKQLDYETDPQDGFIYNSKWVSSDEKIITVSNGLITAVGYGNCNVSLIVNDEIETKISIKVTGLIKEINVPSEYMWLQVGTTSSIDAKAITSDGSSQSLVYKSNNPNIISVSSSGIVSGLTSGVGTVSVTSEDGNKQTIITVYVNPKNGVVNGNGNIWAFTAKSYKTPVRANEGFFKALAASGTGTISNNLYVFSQGGITYSYDYNKSQLIVNGKIVYMRFYYPPSTDLSQMNTFTFLGGTGEASFGSYFSVIDKDPSILKGNGIVILVTTKESNRGYNTDGTLYATNFVKGIIKQKSNAHNNIGGYSKGGPGAAEAMEKGNYQKLLFFNTTFDGVSSKVKTMTKDVIFFSVRSDSMASQTKTSLRQMSNSNYQKVTIVSNSDDMINSFKDKFLVINPGSSMGSGHGYVNITNGHYFMFGCE